MPLLLMVVPKLEIALVFAAVLPPHVVVPWVLIVVSARDCAWECVYGVVFRSRGYALRRLGVDGRREQQLHQARRQQQRPFLH
jgi:hypothetical protein